MNLAAKYRPRNFKEVLGQPVSSRILTNSILMNRIHPILFSGLRGSGKTSLARLFGQAVNCTNFDGDLCGVCEACKNPQLCYTEMDAASNSGVDDVRQLESTLCQLPYYKYRVVILDECHSLSASAQNALLKTLEEPPAHVLLLLVTTNPEKLLPTIRSRCLSMPLQAISTKAAAEGIARVIQGEGYTAETSVVESLARHCDGALRDTYQHLEQLLLCAENRHIRPDDLAQVVGILSTSHYRDLAGLLCAKAADPQEALRYALSEVRRWHNEGRDLQMLFLDGVPTLIHDFSVYLSGAYSEQIEYFSGLQNEEFQSYLTLSLEDVRELNETWERTHGMMRSTMHPEVVWSAYLSMAFSSKEVGFVRADY